MKTLNVSRAGRCVRVACLYRVQLKKLGLKASISIENSSTETDAARKVHLNADACGITELHRLYIIPQTDYRLCTGAVKPVDKCPISELRGKDWPYEHTLEREGLLILS